MVLFEFIFHLKFSGMRWMTQPLMDAMPEFEFVFGSTPEPGNVWIRDPPGKGLKLTQIRRFPIRQIGAVRS